MGDNEKPKQLCEITAEVIERARYNVDKVHESFYRVMRLSKKDYEERCQFKNRSDNN